MNNKTHNASNNTDVSQKRPWQQPDIQLLPITDTRQGPINPPGAGRQS